MRLFRQRQFNDWRSAFEAVEQDVKVLAAGDRSVLSPTIRSQVSASISAPIPAGELFDRISILDIKGRKITDSSKLNHVVRELAELTKLRPRRFDSDQTVLGLVAQLDDANQQLWDVEDRLRDCERNADFGTMFIELARSVYRLNDLRASTKRALSDYYGSDFQEVKSYQPY